MARRQLGSLVRPEIRVVSSRGRVHDPAPLFVVAMIPIELGDSDTSLSSELLFQAMTGGRIAEYGQGDGGAGEH